MNAIIIIIKKEKTPCQKSEVNTQPKSPSRLALGGIQKGERRLTSPYLNTQRNNQIKNVN